MNREMKDSGIDWIGLVPNNWDCTKLGRLCELITDGTHQTPNYIEDGYPFISIKDISSGKLDFSDTKYISEKEHKTLHQHAPVRRGDILFTRIGTLGIFVEVDTDTQFDFFVSVGMLRLLPNVINQHYLLHYLNSPAVGNFIQSIKAGFGTAAPKYNLTDVKRTWVLLPPLPEQHRIADFLDSKCSQIDEISKKIQEEIDTLEAYKKSVITEAVTKGLDPNVEMKDSGIEWIGEIPENWSVQPIKYLFSILSGSTPDSTIPGYWDGEIPWITPADFKTRDYTVSIGHRNITSEGVRSCSTTKVPAGSIVFSKRAPIGTVVINNVELYTNQGCLSCVPNKEAVSKFYYYVMSVYEEVFNLYGSGTTFKEISATVFGNIFLPYTSPEEQHRITDYLDGKCSQIDEAVSNKQQQLSTLEEYKKSLIYEYVTGKKEVV